MNANDVESHWRKVGENLGEPVVGYTLGKYISGGSATGPLWGVLYMTETRFFFHHYPQENWFLSLMSSQKGGAGGGSEDIQIEVPLQGATLIDPDTPTLLQRIFGTGDRIYTLRLAGREPLRFTAEHSRKRFITTLRERTVSS